MELYYYGVCTLGNLLDRARRIYMKRILTVVALSFLFAPLSFANLMDVSTNSPYTDGWQTSDNGGNGFGAWTINLGVNSAAFIATSTGNGGGDTNLDGDIDVGGTAWGLSANSGDTADAIRDFSVALQLGNMVHIEMDNGFISGGGTVGFGLQNAGSGLNRLEVFFVGGGTNYIVQDNGGSQNTGIPFSDEGFDVDFTLTGVDSYSITITPLDLAFSASTINGTLSGTPGEDVDRVRVFNANAGAGAGNDVFYNNLQVIPEPFTMALMAMASFVLFGAYRRYHA